MLSHQRTRHVSWVVSRSPIGGPCVWADTARQRVRPPNTPTRLPKGEPHQAWVTATTPRLAATWSFFLSFRAARKRIEFGPGYEVEFARPAGDYRARGWSFDDDIEDEDGRIIPRHVVQLERLPP